MNTIAASKTPLQNRLEGFALTAIFQGFPAYAGAALALKLAHHDIAGWAVLFVVMTSIFHALLTPWLASRFPGLFGKSYEPLFFDANLSLAEKLEKWRVQPTVSRQLVTTVMMLSLLVVAAVSGG